MTKKLTIETIINGVDQEAVNAPIIHVTELDGIGTNIGLPLTRGVIPAVRALVEQDMQTRRDGGYIFADLNPLELLNREPMTHPTVQRWTEAIARAAEETRFNDD